MRVLLAAVLLAVVAPAALAQADFDLVLKRVTAPPKKVGAGDDFPIRAKIKNTGEKRLGGKLTMFLADGPGRYSVPRRIGRFRVAKIDPSFFRRYTVRLTVPPTQGPGRYRLQTCLKAKGQPLFCDASKRFRVTR